MALLNVVHKPVTAKARQFDGTLESFLEILDARPRAGLTVGQDFDGNGDFAVLRVNGGSLGANLTLRIGDWIVFPNDLTEPAFVLPADKAADDWQPV